VDRSGHKLFSGAALAADEDRDVGPRYALDRVKDPTHSRPVAEDLLAPSGEGGRLAAKCFPVQAGQVARAFQDNAQILQFHRLQVVIERA